ncbi:MFS transporter [Propioniciclava coleopterorum]|uniref:MFS transporter n=1 Tax=Propioniciclava coleopterorum TaxID=2714937 RepID=A0A6G7Y793_9ACTN|nr:MFS transporter [Propioniciclava coleopterorum]QIK72685.1 MFS transporter [Propioniciclava coleopterorum]
MKISSTSARLWWALIAIVLLSLNLRPGATSLGPVLAEVKASLGMGGTMAGLITALPGLCFAVFGALAVTLSLRLGLAGALAAGVTATAIGLLVRPFVGSVAPFVALSVFAFAGMAVGNVLMPAFVKKTFPNRLAGVMSVYTIALAIGATTASMIAVPLASGGPEGWRVSLGVWGAVAAVAALVWLLLAASERRRRLPVDADAPRRSGSVFAVMGSRKAVGMAVFFGTQSMQAYVQFGWIAQMYRDGGLDPLQAGIMASIIPGFGIPAGFIMPTVAQRMKDPRPIVIVLGLLLVAGYTGIWLAPTAAPILWAVLLGLAGFSFPFALALFTIRTRDPHVTTQVSGFAQSVGYLFSAAGPFIVGMLFEVTGSWTMPLWFLLFTAFLVTVSGLVAAKPGYVDDELARA